MEIRSDAKRYDLVSMGRASIDLYANDIGVPFAQIKSFAAYIGGCPTNIAVSVCRLGLRTALITAVGEDPVGDFILQFLESEGVQIQYTRRKPGTRSAAVLLGIEPPNRFPMVMYRDNAPDVHLNVEDVLAAPLGDSRAFVFAGTNLAHEPIRSATILAAHIANSAGATVFMDLDFRADQWSDPRAFGVAVRSVLPWVDVAFGTEEEIKAVMLRELQQLKVTHSQITAPKVSGDLDSAIHSLLASGLNALVVKRGALGSAIYLPGNEKAITVPGFRVEVYNVLGAGDAYAGGFIYGYLQGWDWPEAARMGNACGAIIVTRHGCANFMPYKDEALKFIEERSGL